MDVKVKDRIDIIAIIFAVIFLICAGIALFNENADEAGGPFAQLLMAYIIPTILLMVCAIVVRGYKGVIAYIILVVIGVWQTWNDGRLGEGSSYVRIALILLIIASAATFITTYMSNNKDFKSNLNSVIDKFDTGSTEDSDKAMSQLRIGGEKPYYDVEYKRTVHKTTTHREKVGEVKVEGLGVYYKPEYAKGDIYEDVEVPYEYNVTEHKTFMKLDDAIEFAKEISETTEEGYATICLMFEDKLYTKELRKFKNGVCVSSCDE